MGTTIAVPRAPAATIGTVGIWSAGVRFAPDGAGTAAAAELEQLGCRMAWVPGGIDDGVLASLDLLLDATTSLQFGSSILNIWKHDPSDVARWWAGQSPARRARLLIGMGVSHGALIGDAYERPLAKMRSYLAALDDHGMPLDRVLLAALGPQMLELAASRVGGACPFLVTPGHSATARSILGSDALLAPEQGVVLETDPATARSIAREVVQGYASLPNYTNSWLREGFSEEDIARLSDRLIDGLIAWGDIDAIAVRVREHIDAGADHVALQAIGPGGMMRPISGDLDDWRKLAGLFGR
ncbi:MAG: TIGR03620 family F420-dependent LLM class oxidoreductase [Novosphingobium sp.]